MYHGKYNAKKSPKRCRRLRWRKEIMLLSSIAVLLVGVIGGSLAYLISNSEQVDNALSPAKTGIDIEEKFNKESKENVKVKNTGEYPVYARATYVAYWVSDEEESAGTVLPEIPELTSSFGSDWTKNGDGYWYYSKILAEGETSSKFIDSMTADKVEGRHLVVDVIMETVQAVGIGPNGKTPVEEVWGISANIFIKP